MELLRLHEAAQLMGVSYPTLKRWIYNGKVKSVKTAGDIIASPRARSSASSEPISAKRVRG